MRLDMDGLGTAGNPFSKIILQTPVNNGVRGVWQRIGYFHLGFVRRAGIPRSRDVRLRRKMQKRICAATAYAESLSGEAMSAFRFLLVEGKAQEDR